MILWESSTGKRKLNQGKKKEFSRIWVGSLISWCSAHCKVVTSIFEPLYIVLSLPYQTLDFALKSTRRTTKNGLFKHTLPRVNSTFSAKVSKVSWIWFGNRYNKVKLRYPEHWNTGLVSSGVSLISWGIDASKALVGRLSSDGITIKIPSWVDIFLYRTASHPIFSYWVPILLLLKLNPILLLDQLRPA